MKACTRHGQSSFRHFTSYTLLLLFTTLNSFLRDIDHSFTASLTASMVGYFDPCTTSFSLYSDSGHLTSFAQFGCQNLAPSTQLALGHPPRLMSPHLAASVLPPHLHCASVPRLWEFSLPHLPVLVVLFQLHAPIHFVLHLRLPQLVLPFVHFGYLHFPQ